MITYFHLLDEMPYLKNAWLALSEKNQIQGYLKEPLGKATMYCD